MAADRFACYLAGGCPPGASRTVPGARDRTLPRATQPVWLEGSVYFARESPTWGGGIAFYDAEARGESIGVAYRLSLAQFSDVAAREMHREPGTDLDLLPLNPPVPAYLATTARDIARTHGWSTDEIVDYLLARPGAGDAWDAIRLRNLPRMPDHD